MKALHNLVSHFQLQGTPQQPEPLGSGLINDSYLVRTVEADAPDYVLQRINHAIFQDVDLLQHNIRCVTEHIRRQLEAAGTPDLDRRVLRFIPAETGKDYWFDGTFYWRMMVFVKDSFTHQAVTPTSSRNAGLAFGQFQAQLADLPETLGETIPNFHHMEFRLHQLDDAVAADAVGRVAGVQDLLEAVAQRRETMCQAERLYREGKLPKRICHCDTKVNNMLFDADDNILCVIDLDTVMPSFIFSDFGDFLRTGANPVAEDEPDLNRIDFDLAIFEAFTEGYLQSARSFLTPLEIELLPYAAELFPYMQFVRFLTDWINGDTYYKIQYPEHNLVRSRAQLQLLTRVEACEDKMKSIIRTLLSKQ